jgi:hypothetical protein
MRNALIYKKSYRIKAVSVAFGAVLLSACSWNMALAQSDTDIVEPNISYIQDIHLKHVSLPIVPDISISTQYGGGNKRTDITLDAIIVTKHLSTIYNAQQHRSVRMDLDKKIYTILPPGSGGDLSNLLSRFSKRQVSSEGQQDSSKLAPASTTIHIEDEGAEYVGNTNAHHYKIDIIAQSSKASEAPNETIIDTWISSIKTPYSQIGDFLKSSPEKSNAANTINGDVELAKKIAEYVPLKLEISKDDKIVAKMTTRNISTDAVDPNVFQIPSDYQKVSQEEFRNMENENGFSLR